MLRRRAALAPLAVIALATCAPRPPSAEAPAARVPAAGATQSASAAGDVIFRYEVTAGEGARELSIAAVIPANSGPTLEVDEGAARFVREIECSTGDAYQALPSEHVPVGGDGETMGQIWRPPACPPEGCKIRYRFALADAAREIDEIDVAAERNGAFLSPPSAWLIHPCDPVDGQRFRVHVATPPGIAFATGLFPAPSGAPDEYEAQVSDLPRPPYSAFGDLRKIVADVPGMRVEIAKLPGQIDLPDEAIRRWVSGAAGAVRDYYDLPPISRALLILAPSGGHGVGFALTMGNGGASVFAPIGRESTSAEIDGSWELIHEMLHVAFPILAREHRWLAEGIATYVEPILRARRGIITPEVAYGRLFRRMAFGLPGPGDRGLDRTPTWGRIYWGGALFCLLADIEIRQRTDNRRSLDDALRAILAAGGNVSTRWEMDEIIATGDHGIGVPVLAELYAKMAEAPFPVDLDALWRRLGVSARGAGVAFDDGAELAAIRRAIVAPTARDRPASAAGAR